MEVLSPTIVVKRGRLQVTTRDWTISLANKNRHWNLNRLPSLADKSGLEKPFFFIILNGLCQFNHVLFQLMPFLDTFFHYQKESCCRIFPQNHQDLPWFASLTDMATTLVPMFFFSAEILSWLLENFHASPMEARDAGRIGGA